MREQIILQEKLVKEMIMNILKGKGNIVVEERSKILALIDMLESNNEYLIDYLESLIEEGSEKQKFSITRDIIILERIEVKYGKIRETILQGESRKNVIKAMINREGKVKGELINE